MQVGARILRIFFAAAFAALAACSQQPATPSVAGLERIEHIIVIYVENRSFDHLYGLFPGADGIANATAEQYTQVDNDGKPLPYLPPVWKGREADPAFPKNLPNRPFQIDAAPINLPLSVPTRDLVFDRGMMGDGVIDLASIRRMIEAAGFDGPQEVEIFSAENWWKRDPAEVVTTCVERYQACCRAEADA